ncbi:MAG TPA: hypothetical protein VJ770_14855 [Stellaceae bacterium]|nr:hypothetical protein [Stellaceae bacterium]
MNRTATGSSASCCSARGDARADSNYDIAVFIEGLGDRWSEINRIIPAVTDIIDDTGAVIHAICRRLILHLKTRPWR